jgi:hypothetical protein
VLIAKEGKQSKNNVWPSCNTIYWLCTTCAHIQQNIGCTIILGLPIYGLNGDWVAQVNYYCILPDLSCVSPEAIQEQLVLTYLCNQEMKIVDSCT